MLRIVSVMVFRMDGVSRIAWLSGGLGRRKFDVLIRKLLVVDWFGEIARGTRKGQGTMEHGVRLDESRIIVIVQNIVPGGKLNFVI
jgi:hypothetical protein